MRKVSNVAASQGRSNRAGAQLLVDALKSWPQRPAPADPRTVAKADLTWILRAATYHGIEPALYVYLKGAISGDCDVLDALRRSHISQVIRHLQVIADLQKLATALDAGDVPWVAVKGPILAELYWGRPDLRRYGDLDIVVHPMQLSKVLEILESLGGKLIDVNWAMILDRMRGELSVALPGGTALDLHWHVANEQEIRESFAFDTEQMLARRRMVSVGHSQIPTWDPADTLLHTAFHCAVSGAHQLVWLKDVHVCVSEPELDWDDVIARARATRSTIVLSTVLHRVERVFGRLDVPEAARQSLRKAGPWRAATAVFDMAAPPSRLPWRGPSGRAAFQCIRGSSGTTLGAFVRNVRIAVRARTADGAETLEENALHVADGDDSAKRTYLTHVSSNARG